MSFVLVRPTAQHDPAKVTGATSQDGLTVEEPAPASANAGNLRLRCSGTAIAALSADVKLQTSGAPRGYTTPGGTFLWKHTTESSTQWRGYVDTPTVTRVAHPITYDSGMREPSTPRLLPDGYLGVMINSTPGVEQPKFYRVSTAWAASMSTMAVAVPAAGVRPDFVVLPSGRLMAYAYDEIIYSDDSGVTWTDAGAANTVFNGATQDVICVEAVGDQVVMLCGSSTGAVATTVALSNDGGFTWTTTDTATTLRNPRTCVVDGVVYVSSLNTTTHYVSLYKVVPGGALEFVVATAVKCYGTACIGARDDGTIWVFGWQASAANAMNGQLCYSADGGATTSTSTTPIDLSKTGYGTNGYSSLSMGMFGEKMIMVARHDSSTGSDAGISLVGFGEWSTYPESGVRVGYTSLDYPDALGWTVVTTGGGATITNQPYLRLVSTAGNGTRYVAPAAIWNPAAGDHKQIKMRLRVNSGGSLASTDCALQATIGDGANQQGITIRFTSTGARCYNSSGTQVGSDLVLAMTAWTDLLIDFWHDLSAGVSGLVSVYYHQDGADGVWTAWLSALAVLEQAGTSTTALQWRGQNAQSADLSELLVSAGVSPVTNPSALVGRPFVPGYDLFVSGGVYLGAYGTGGVSGDTYTLTTPYSYGAERVWTELRPSSRCQSSADGGNWELDLDAGASDLFHGDTVAVFATNFRTALWQMSSSSTFATTPISVSLDATLTTFTVSAAGVGYIEASGVNWRPGQWKSNGDSRRFFIDVAGTRYEITDNDDKRVKVRGVDLSAASGTIAIFGDRMAARMPAHAAYRYARLYVGAQDTADGKYRVGTPILGDAFTPEQLYDFGFVDRLEPNVTTTDADSGSSLSYRRGPALSSLSIQWPPLDKLRIDAEDRIADFYRACEGSLTPIVLWRDTGDLSTLMLVQIRETLTRTNVRGEGADALTRIDQLVLREVW